MDRISQKLEGDSSPECSLGMKLPRPESGCFSPVWPLREESQRQPRPGIVCGLSGHFLSQESEFLGVIFQ